MAAAQRLAVLPLLTPEQQLKCSALVPPAAAAGQTWQESGALPYVSGTFGRYRVRLAKDARDRLAACRLRFNVFNIEMGEGLSSSYSTGLDRDRFDPVCDHLIVENQDDGRIVGTYRMQSGLTAAAAFGYYSAQEFEFAPFECIRDQVLELGRASIDREHRSSEVLTLLWRGIAQYAKHHGLRYLIGCSSLTSKDPLEGWSLYRQLGSQLVSFEYVTVPTAAFALPCPEGEPRSAGQAAQVAADLPWRGGQDLWATCLGPRFRHHRLPYPSGPGAGCPGGAKPLPGGVSRMLPSRRQV